MKKNYVSLALIAIFVLIFSSCKKDEVNNNNAINNGNNPIENPTANIDKLCYKKGWVLKSATVTPAITVSGKTTTDFYADYLYEYEQDDIMVFAKSGSETIKPGSKKPADDTEDGYVEDQTSTWRFNHDESVLTCQLPMFYDLSVFPARTFSPEFEKCTITKLTDTEMILEHSIIITFEKAEYNLTLTYHHAN